MSLIEVVREIPLSTAHTPRALARPPCPAFLAHRVAAHVEAMGVVNSCEVSTVERILAGFADLPEVAPLGFVRRSRRPIIDDEYIDPAPPRQ